MNKNRWAETNSIFRLLHWNFLFGFWFFGRIYDERKTFELHSKELQHMHTHYTPYNTYTSSDGLFVYFYVFSFSAAARFVVRVKREIGTALSAAAQHINWKNVFKRRCVPNFINQKTMLKYMGESQHQHQRNQEWRTRNEFLFNALCESLQTHHFVIIIHS